MGFLFPLKKKKQKNPSIIHNVDTKFSVLWVPKSPPLKNKLIIFSTANSFHYFFSFKGKDKCC